MRSIVLLLTCVVSSLSELADQKKSKEGVQELVTSSSDAFHKIVDIKLKIDHSKNNESEKGFSDRNDDDINYTYPDNVQLVPNIPVSPHTPRYSLVPVRRGSTTTPSYGSDFDFGPTFPPTRDHHESDLNNPHHQDYPEAPSYHHNYDDDEEETDDAYEEESDDFDDHEDHDGDHYYHDDYQEHHEYPVGSSPTERTPSTRQVYPRVVVKHRPEHANPLVITNYPAYEMNDGAYTHLQTPNALVRVKHAHQTTSGSVHSPLCNENSPLGLHPYGPPQSVPIPTFRQFNHAPYVIYPKPLTARTQRSKVYVRYPRNFKTYYHHQAPTVTYRPQSKVRVMTQSFVYHPKEHYSQYRNPVMMSSVPELRNAQSPPPPPPPPPPTKSKKKRKRKKSKSANGECKPKKIIKEIHFHHYDPQLSAQLAPLEGIDLKDGEDLGGDIKVFTKETEIDENAKPDYDDDYKKEVQKEVEKQRKRKSRSRRKKRPSYYDDSSYSPSYDSSGSTEYIDYNVQTDSKSTTLLSDRVFDTQKSSVPMVTGASNSTATSYSSFQIPLEGGSYVRQESIKFISHPSIKDKRQATTDNQEKVTK